jgi:hypothetical protein
MQDVRVARAAQAAVSIRLAAAAAAARLDRQRVAVLADRLAPRRRPEAVGAVGVMRQTQAATARPRQAATVALVLPARSAPAAARQARQVAPAPAIQAVAVVQAPRRPALAGREDRAPISTVRMALAAAVAVQGGKHQQVRRQPVSAAVAAITGVAGAAQRDQGRRAAR